MLLQPKGIDPQRRARAVRRPPQYPLPRGVIDLPFLVGCTCIPFGEVIQESVAVVPLKERLVTLPQAS
jgi:hypothetical protein